MQRFAIYFSYGTGVSTIEFFGSFAYRLKITERSNLKVISLNE